jgi:hypothetical protein
MRAARTQLLIELTYDGLPLFRPETPREIETKGSYHKLSPFRVVTKQETELTQLVKAEMRGEQGYEPDRKTNDQSIILRPWEECSSCKCSSS